MYINRILVLYTISVGGDEISENNLIVLWDYVTLPKTHYNLLSNFKVNKLNTGFDDLSALLKRRSRDAGA